MSNIFNLFGTSDEPIKQVLQAPGTATKLSMRPGASGIPSGNAPGKFVGTPIGKPRGLSIRPKCDTNVIAGTSYPSIAKKSQNEDLLKPKLTQLDIYGHPISPNKKGLPFKNQGSKPVSPRRVSPKPLSPSYVTLSEDSVFKKPLPLKNAEKRHSVYREPEKLAPYYDEEYEFCNNIYNIDLDYQRLASAMNNSLEIYEDEGFESDPEPLEIPPLETDEILRPTFFTQFSDDESDNNVSFELPEISDEDDF